MKSTPLTRSIPYVAALILIAGFARLGFWQLDRAAEKAALFEDFDRVEETAPRRVEISGFRENVDAYSPVELAGRYDSRSVLLDNQVRNGQQGVHVLTPLLDESGSSAVLINRGWLPLDAARQSLPEFATPTDRIKLTGISSRPPRPGLQLGEVTIEANWPQLQTYVDLDALSEALNLQLAPAVVLLDPAAPHGFSRDWRPQVMGADRHRGYAFQWFALSLTVFIVTIVLTLRRKR